MSKIFRINAGLFIGILLFAGFSTVSAQTTNNLLTISIQKVDGKLFKLDAMNEKVFEFMLSGVKSLSDIDQFKTNLSKQPSIRLVNIIPTVAADYMATVTLVPEAKVRDFKLALMNMGYTSILIDGETRLLSEPDSK